MVTNRDNGARGGSVSGEAQRHEVLDPALIGRELASYNDGVATTDDRLQVIIWFHCDHKRYQYLNVVSDSVRAHDAK